MQRWLRWGALLFLLVATGIAFAGTAMKIGAQSPEDPQGVSLRQTSSRSRGHGFFWVYYGAGRGHRGGGLSGGK